MLFWSVTSVPSVARFCNSSSTPVSRFLSSSPSLRLRSSSNLLPTLALTAGDYSGGVSSYLASTICHCSYSSSSSVSQSESAQEKTSPFCFDAAIDSMVQIFYFFSEPKPLQPWDKSDTEEKKDITSGFAVSGKRILADSGILSNYSSWSFRVRKFGSATFYAAKVEAVVPECCLATLVVDSEEFWETMKPLELGDEIPSVGETVSVFGYGYDTIKLVQGTVSSVEPKEYFHGTAELLSIELNMDSCYSSGPVVMGNKIVGFRPGMDDITPTSVIKHVLSSLEERLIGSGSLDITWQSMENAQLRRHFKMSDDMTGVLINRMHPLSNALRVLKEHDVILAVEGFPVSNDGKVHFQRKEWLDLNHLVSMKKPGETALVKILRHGKEHVFHVGLNFTVFLDDINKEYSSLKNIEVKKVNGVEVVNLKHLSELIENCCTEDLRFDLEEGYVIVLNNQYAKEATPLILERHGIPSAISSDLQ
ncbi:unnamed protein product [Microthlaspi erraticum]|uniref:Protease Do-like PDZ domain-containing protein n=1 Tax=Microthlaspi erraticum TaxID=1685480 RepID=A0A6D2IB54_9BRAS|nr:unnamed protein product [Microthlaspi erraticum]